MTGRHRQSVSRFPKEQPEKRFNALKDLKCELSIQHQSAARVETNLPRPADSFRAPLDLCRTRLKRQVSVHVRDTVADYPEVVKQGPDPWTSKLNSVRRSLQPLAKTCHETLVLALAESAFVGINVAEIGDEFPGSRFKEDIETHHSRIRSE